MDTMVTKWKSQLSDNFLFTKEDKQEISVGRILTSEVLGSLNLNHLKVLVKEINNNTDPKLSLTIF